jgi:hypothetical protein
MRIERLFGKIKKLPKKSSFLERFGDSGLDLEERKDGDKSKGEKQQLVKIVGLDPK